jgi:hypothetical protein
MSSAGVAQERLRAEKPTAGSSTHEKVRADMPSSSEGEEQEEPVRPMLSMGAGGAQEPVRAQFTGASETVRTRGEGSSSIGRLLLQGIMGVDMADRRKWNST